MPILPGLLEQLTRFQRNSHSAAVRDLCTELSLTVPVRLIAMLPYLRQLMYPLVSALSSHNNMELVATGIKLIDLCVENFTAEFLEPVFAEVKTQILSALWRHLKPMSQPQALGISVLRIFAKLGGRSRDFVYQPPLIHYTRDHNLESGLVVSLTLQPNSPAVPIALDKALDTYLRSRLLDADHQISAFNFVRSLLDTILHNRLPRLSNVYSSEPPAKRARTDPNATSLSVSYFFFF